MCKLKVNNGFRIAFLAFLDIVALALAEYLSLFVRYELEYLVIPPNALGMILKTMPYWVPVNFLIFSCFKLYNRLWEYVSLSEAIRVVFASLLSTVALIVIASILKVDIYASVYVLIGIFLTVFTLTTRFYYRLVKAFLNLFTGKTNSEDGRKNIMIIGAGNAGNSLLREIISDRNLSNIKVVCVIDDDKSKHGKVTNGVKIVGGRRKIQWAAENYQVDEILLAIPSASIETRKEILNICKDTKCVIKTLPSVYQIVNNTAMFSMLKKIEIGDLLGRQQIKLDCSEISSYIKGKTVLVTGAGGSIGSELCRQLATCEPATLIIFDIYENSTLYVNNELTSKYPNIKIVSLIGSVRDKGRLEYLFSTYSPDIVYHAAAHKHVPLMESSPNESVKNNVFGTLNVVRLSDKFGVSRFVMISTDKAVNPTSIMGATKRICEMIIQTYDRLSATEFVAVRFGNVLGSNGSVIPIFEKQIAKGGPVTVTHPDIIRYFMTITEAVSLVLQAGAYARGGEIFTLDMGEPVKILSLAENMIRLSGKVPYRDIDIVFTGLRPGEKKFEELLMAEEGLQSTKNDKIFICQPLAIDLNEFSEKLKELSIAASDERSEIHLLVKQIVPTYVLPSERVKDTVETDEEAESLASCDDKLSPQSMLTAIN
ncbi:MAG: polysaccharide biosynthesis protein [Oscillospiraceae bacterium]|nr:polysaccharide biosynthesis protein [Oscillospiraceae bacterium]